MALPYGHSKSHRSALISLILVPMPLPVVLSVLTQDPRHPWRCQFDSHWKGSLSVGDPCTECRRSQLMVTAYGRWVETYPGVTYVSRGEQSMWTYRPVLVLALLWPCRTRPPISGPSNVIWTDVLRRVCRWIVGEATVVS